MSQAGDSWAWTKLETYEQCPYRFKLKYIDKEYDPPGAAMERGNVIHKEAENFLKSSDMELSTPTSLRGFTTLFNILRADQSGLMVEESWGFTPRWEPTGWMSRNPRMPTWFRAKCDVAALYDNETYLLVGDHKSGQLYQKNQDQVELFGLAGMMRFPNARHVETRLWYVDDQRKEFKGQPAEVDQGKELIDHFDAKDKPALLRKWNERASFLFAETVWAPRPNDKCRFCTWSFRHNGGKCRAG